MDSGYTAHGITYGKDFFNFVRGHEKRRLKAYRLAYEAYLVKIKEETEGRLTCCNEPGEAAKILRNYFGEISINYMKAYSKYIRDE